MLLHRVRGLWNTYHGILAVIFTVVFWIYLVITGSFPRELAGVLSDLFCIILGVLGLVIAAVPGRSAAATLLATGFVESHTLALKQTVHVGIAMLIRAAGRHGCDGPRSSENIAAPRIFVVLYGVFFVPWPFSKTTH